MTLIYKPVPKILVIWLLNPYFFSMFVAFTPTLPQDICTRIFFFQLEKSLTVFWRKKTTTSAEVNQLNSIFNCKESHKHLKDPIMSCGNEAIALAKNEVICVCEFKAHFKYYYNVIKKVTLIPSKYLLDDRFFKDHSTTYYIFY